jgi:hypothetical protein
VCSDRWESSHDEILLRGVVKYGTVNWKRTVEETCRDPHLGLSCLLKPEHAKVSEGTEVSGRVQEIKPQSLADGCDNQVGDVKTAESSAAKDQRDRGEMIDDKDDDDYARDAGGVLKVDTEGPLITSESNETEQHNQVKTSSNGVGSGRC